MTARHWLLGLACSVVWASGVQGAFTQIRPTVDRDGASQDSPDVGPFVLRPDGGGALIIGSGWDSGLYYRTTMEFSLAGVLPTVLQAKLTFHPEVVANPPAAYRTHGYSGDGVVTALDMEISNEIAPIRTTNDPPEVDVTSFVQSLVSQHASYAGFTLSGFPGGHGLSITSSEPYVDSPLLSITSVPEPTMGAAALLLAAVTGMRRRARN